MSSATPLPSCSQRLGDFVATFAANELSEALRHEAKRSILNLIGCALAAPKEPAVSAALQVMQSFSGAPAATVFGRAERLDVVSAAFINAMAGNLLDFDDTHLRTVIHPSAPVAPPLLALAEKDALSGEQVLLAFVLGAEIECRLGNAVTPGHYARGWHITATCGVFGAAAATARLLGLDAATTSDALGIAASQSAGVVENLPNAAKNVGVGNAARNGLFAALLAESGYCGALTAIEGPRGWARAAGYVLNEDEAPLSDAQLEAKFRDNARHGGSGCDVDAALAALWGLDDAADVNDLMRALAAREGSESA